jgi:cellulose synthase/poly-beta-1,6-N-acetylglucosamine synthase-like glycosyltransferase
MITDFIVGVMLLVAAFYLIGGPLMALFYVKVSYPRRRLRWGRDPEFSVNVIVPCKGASGHLGENLRAIAAQDYPRFTITFVTDTAHDDAVPAIKEVVRSSPRAKHLVAGYAEHCGQKNHVQLVAIDADRESDVFVVCDSDLRPAPGWLREMVRPYADPKVAVTGSARWIEPSHAGLGPYIYTGMAGYYPMAMSQPFFSLVWGGCFSISRKAFVELKIADMWGHTEDDDLVLSHHLAAHGGRPVFVPPAISTSHEVHATVRHLVKWFTRQGLTGRLHAFWAWVFLVLIETLVSAGFVVSVGVIIAQAVSGRLDYHSLLAPALLVLMTLNAFLVKVPYWKKKDMPLIWWLLVPVPGHIVLSSAIWRSVFMKKMDWGSVTYEFNKDGTIRRIIRTEKTAPGG